MPEHRGSWHAGVNGAQHPAQSPQHPHAHQPPSRPQPPPASQSAPPPSGPAPPRPPNPELLSLQTQLQAKLSAYLHSTLSAGHERNEQMRRVVADLDRGAPAVLDEMARLEAVRDVCRATGDGLQRSVDEVQARIRELNERPSPSADELICATSIVGNQ
jgi:ESCRT-I complex subunit TSG101